MRILALLALSLVMHLAAIAQIDYDKFPEVSSTCLINDVIIQTSPKDSFGLGDILIRDGRIAKIARQIAVPRDGYVIEGDTAYAYPAFIAGLSHAGIAKSEKKTSKPEVKFRGYPPNAVVGITPEIKATELINPTEASIAKFKENGFAMAHVVPRGQLLPGQGSIIFLTEDKDKMFFQEDNSMYMQMKGTRGFYPATIIGVMAKWRDLYHQAAGLAKHHQIYKANPKVKRPAKDKSLEALIPVTQKQQPVYLSAPTRLDIHKALALQKEMNYKLVLTDVKQGWALADKYKRQSVKVLLSPELPKSVADKKDAKAKKGDKKKADKKLDEPATEKVAKSKKEKPAKSAETLALEKRQKQAQRAYVAQAAQLDSLGIDFGFSFTKAKPSDLKKTLKRMMEAGLTKEAALAALTTQPAAILGIGSEVGTLTQGKLANLFISTKPYFDEGSHIKYMIVEGAISELEVKKKSEIKADGSAIKKLKGNWSYTVEGPGENFTGELKISGDEDLVIVLTDDDDPSASMKARDISFEDNELSFTIDVPMPGGSEPAKIELTIDDDSCEGTAILEGLGTMPFSATKNNPE